MPTALKLLRDVSSALNAHGIADSGKEAEIIMTEGTGLDRLSLWRDDPPVGGRQAEKIDEMLKRRLGREPLQYIIGHVEFYGLRINVGPGVLIPRPETEILVEESLKFIGEGEAENLRIKRSLSVLDLCTGSGCVALALAKNFPSSLIYAVDIEGDALRYAEGNALENGIKNATFLRGSLYEPVEGMTFDLIVSNPPYIKSSLIAGLQPEVRDFEPEAALDGGEDGLSFIREIIAGARERLSPGGAILLEIAEGQAQAVEGMMRAGGIAHFKTARDYAGIDRVVAGRV